MQLLHRKDLYLRSLLRLDEEKLRREEDDNKGTEEQKTREEYSIGEEKKGVSNLLHFSLQHVLVLLGLLDLLGQLGFGLIQCLFQCMLGTLQLCLLLVRRT